MELWHYSQNKMLVSLRVRQTLSYNTGVPHIIIYIALSGASAGSWLHVAGDQKHFKSLLQGLVDCFKGIHTKYWYWSHAHTHTHKHKHAFCFTCLDMRENMWCSHTPACPPNMSGLFGMKFNFKKSNIWLGLFSAHTVSEVEHVCYNLSKSILSY